jgi:signal transduction histidine kinase
MSQPTLLSSARQERTTWLVRTSRRVLAVPLVAKLIGANVIIVAAAILAQTLVFAGRNGAELVTVLVALVAASAMSLFLVRLALEPIEELEDLARRVSAGEFDARGDPSPFADKDLRRLGATVNSLLDSLAAERRRIESLGVELVRAQDLERAHVSRELHDSIAQTLAAVRFQLAAAGREEQIGEVRNRLAAANGMISVVMEEVMNVSYSLHSRVAEDLGLEAALGTLARRVEERTGLYITVNFAPMVPAVSPGVSATLFRVAEEALREIEMRGEAKSAAVNLSFADGRVRIEIASDGPGSGSGILDVGPPSGLASVKGRVMLAGGKMAIDRTSSGGMLVIAELQTMKAAS